MRVIDPALDRHEAPEAPRLLRAAGRLHGIRAGERRQQNWPSTVAYLARLVIHRYAMLGLLDERGYPTREMGVLEAPRASPSPR
jgi:ribonucleoside-diphosphate reductase alpha chain